MSNENRESRSISEARDLATRWGVVIPDYVDFHVAPPGYLDADTYAKTTTFRECEGTIIQWDWFFHEKTGKIPFLIREEVLKSDEGIVAVFGHEMYELEKLRVAFDSHAPIEYWEAETSPHNDGNFHCKAWDYADSLVEKMREGA
jgi:hypothetical protein